MGVVIGLVLGSGLLALEGAVLRRPSRRAELLRRAGIEQVPAAGLLVVEVGAGLAAAAPVQALTGVAGLAAAAFVVGVQAPSAGLRRLARRRAADRRALWPEVVESLASGVDTGLSLPEAMAVLAERGPSPLRPAFAAFAADHRASGRTAEALDRLRLRLADPVGDRAVLLARAAGADATALRALAAFLRAEAEVRAEHEARAGWTVTAARAAVAAPWLVLLLLGTRPDAARAYGTGTGTAVLAAGGLACLLAYRAMVRIGRWPGDRGALP